MYLFKLTVVFHDKKLYLFAMRTGKLLHCELELVFFLKLVIIFKIKLWTQWIINLGKIIYNSAWILCLDKFTLTTPKYPFLRKNINYQKRQRCEFYHVCKHYFLYWKTTAQLFFYSKGAWNIKPQNL